MFQPSSALIETIGYVAGILTTLAFVPQVVMTWRSRSARDLSAAMLTSFATGILLWLVYGVALSAWPIVISNAVTLALTLVLLFLKLRDTPRPS